MRRSSGINIYGWEIGQASVHNKFLIVRGFLDSYVENLVLMLFLFWFAQYEGQFSFDLSFTLDVLLTRRHDSPVSL